MGLQFIEFALALFLIIYFQNFNLSKTENLEKKIVKRWMENLCINLQATL